MHPIHPPRSVRPLRARMAAVVVAAVTTACFGGGGDDPAPTGPTMASSVPDSALASVAAYTQFTLTTSQSASDTAEPLRADNVTAPPSSETDEPVPVP